jgi:hypothetical protein
MGDIGVTIIKGKEEDSTCVDVLFGYTSLAQDSTLIENYDFVQYKLNDVFENWTSLNKQTCFVFKGIKFEASESRYGLEKISNDNYVFHEPIHNKYIPDFLSSSNKKFDMVFLGECPNLIELFLDSKTMRSLFDEDVDVLYKKVKQFYNGLKSNAILINLHYDTVEKTTSFSNLELFYSYACIWSLDVFLFLLRMMNRMFKKIEPGIYQKENLEDIDKVMEEVQDEVVKELFEIGVEKIDKTQELIETIDKKYFDGRLNKQKEFSPERPILHVIKTIVDDLLSTTMIAE